MLNEAILLGLIFLMAAYLGLELITKVPSLLHTPLMSGANAISGITLLAGITLILQATTPLLLLLGFLAVFFATLNVVGGYAVTQRMLNMFLKNKQEKP